MTSVSASIRSHVGGAAGALAVVALLFGGTNVAFAQSAAPRLTQSDLEYLGAFRMPQGTPRVGGDLPFYDGGRALAFNAARNSLFLVGHPWHNQTAEISIPELRKGVSQSQLAAASLLQPFADAVEGRLRSINPSYTSAVYIGGQLVHSGRLYVSGYTYYDVAGTQVASHFGRPLSLATRGDLNGPVKIGSVYPGYVYGYMASVPPEWQPLLGGPAIAGNCCNPGASVVSQGPAASIFDPSAIGRSNPVPGIEVLGYPLANHLGPGEATTNPIYNLTTRITGAVFPSGSRSVLFFGRHGTGRYCYGEGSECNDPADNAKGTHAYPYRYQVWAYDANELVEVKAGRKARYDVQPYSYWTFELPYENGTGKHQIGGAAYDPGTQTIYLSQICADAECYPIIHAFRIRGSAPRPSPPAGLRAD